MILLDDKIAMMISKCVFFHNVGFLSELRVKYLLSFACKMCHYAEYVPDDVKTCIVSLLGELTVPPLPL